MSNMNSHDEPPMSRLFVICNKTNTEDELREAFQKFGTIDDIFLVKDHKSGENKGIAYIKFTKTSDAAQALEELNGTIIGDGNNRAVKILVAASRNSKNPTGRTDNEQEKYVRLFIVINKTETEEDIREEFGQYGTIDNISIVKDRSTGQPKGFCYVRYNSFYHAALAFENCNPRFKAVFADPKSSNKSNEREDFRDTRRNSNYDDFAFSRNGGSSGYGSDRFGSGATNDFSSRQVPNIPTSLEVICSSTLNQDQLWKLFDLIPGLDYCQLVRERGPRINEATVVYNSAEQAVYAREKLHGFEYPPGERLIVRLLSSESTTLGSYSSFGSDSGARRSSNRYCSVDLPPPQPLASPNATCAQRCFIVFSKAVPMNILKNVFSTFGNLIDIYLLPNKNCGYIKYGTVESAQRAIELLNGAEIMDARMKVMEAEEKTGESRKRQRRD